MSYKTILVGIDIDAPSSSIISFAADLARRFEARLIGVSAADGPPPLATTDGMVVGGEIVQAQRKDIETRLEHLRAKLLKLAGASLEIEWRGAVDNPTRRITEMARGADLIVAASPEGASAASPYRSIDLGSLTLNAGRPVLVAAGGAEHLAARRVLVAWKDTREARRALADALPILVGADDVLVATVDRHADAATADSVADATAFLTRHGVKARGEVLARKDEAKALTELARSMHADLVVSGAYGHSRLREWVFGGVTRSLLDDSGLNRLMSS